MERSMECSICHQIKQPTKELKYPCNPCDSCRNQICIECSQLSASEIKCLPLRSRLLKFYCQKCRNLEIVNILQDSLKDKEQIINDKNEIIKMLQEKIKQYEEKELKCLPQISYADMIKQNLNRTTTKTVNHPNIIVKPKVKQDSIKTKQDIDTHVNPANLKIGVKQIKPTNSGSIIIKCQTKKDTEVLEKAIKDNLANGYEIDLTKMRKPKIKIVNFAQDMSKEQIEKCISEQNELQGNIKVTYIRKTRKRAKTIFCECSSTAFAKIIHNKKICIGWERYMVYEDLEILRCFRCQEFHHKKQDCQNKLVCPICSDEHEEEICPKRRKCCRNCVISNEKYHTKYNVNHSASDLKCPSLEYHQKVLQNRTDYHSEW